MLKLIIYNNANSDTSVHQNSRKRTNVIPNNCEVGRKQDFLYASWSVKWFLTSLSHLAIHIKNV